MKEDNKDSIYYLEQNKNAGNSTFNKEVQSLEFVQKIGDREFHNDYKKRDSFLMKHGKRLFRKFRNKKPENINKLRIKIKNEPKILSKKEIDELLTFVYAKNSIFDKIKRKIKMFYSICSGWKIIISKNNIYYKFSLGGIEKIDYNKTVEYTDLDIDFIFDGGILSQEEIDNLLTAINEVADDKN